MTTTELYLRTINDIKHEIDMRLLHQSNAFKRTIITALNNYLDYRLEKINAESKEEFGVTKEEDLKFELVLDKSKMLETANKIAEKKILRIIAKELESSLATMRGQIKDAIQKALEESKIDIHQKTKDATKEFLKTFEPRIEETVKAILKKSLEDSRMMAGLSFHIDIKE